MKTQPSSNLRSVSLVLLFSLALAATSSAATFVVTTLADSGAGSLRQALIDANASPGNKVTFAVTGNITLSSPLPAVTRNTTIDGTTAPGYSGAPRVGIDFAGNPGLQIARSARGAIVKGLSLVRATSAALILQAPEVTVQANYIGLGLDGSARENFGDGIRVEPGSSGNLIGNFDPVESIDYYDTEDSSDFPVQPVTAWQGLRNYAPSATDFLICGTSNANGLLYVGPIEGGGTSYLVNFPGGNTTATSVYGPDNLEGGLVRLVGSYRVAGSTEFNFGFVWEGALGDLPSGGTFQQIAYPRATYQFTHSTMGGLAVGNADSPTRSGLPLGPGRAYIYDVENQKFITDIVYPGSKSNTAYGIWHNGEGRYTICGGFSPLPTNNLLDQNRPLNQGRAFLVDYDANTGRFSNWTAFDYPNGPNGVRFITHFEGISSTEPGVYYLSADSVQSGTSNPAQGSWVTVRRNSDGKFDRGTWVDLNFSGDGISSSNSVYGNQVVGLQIGTSGTTAFQAEINLGFQLSNVISANRGNGITLNGSRGNIIAMNQIGTNVAGDAVAGFGNGLNGIFLTQKAANNLIGGQVAGPNNPTGDKGRISPVFFRPPQGNLISGNRMHGVLIENGSTGNILSGNFIGTDATGLLDLGNFGHGVLFESAGNNSLIGCTFYENPFVFYNVISGNGGDGVRVNNSDNITIQANFLGIGAENDSMVLNDGNGLTVLGTSRNTQVGGVIPLGNVIAGNQGNGIAVLERARGFISFNTFGGLYAFGGPAPNGRNGILITSTGGNNVIRTCIISGNAQHGVLITGNASGVQILDTAIGTNTDIDAAMPNGWDGVHISGTAHRNVLGGLRPSIEARNHFSGNNGYGVNITGQAYNNVIYNSNIGYGYSLTDGLEPVIPNQWGGILLDQGTQATTIGGTRPLQGNKICANEGGGLTIFASTRNSIISNRINDNQEFGIYAFGSCTGTRIERNTTQGNGSGPADNVDLSEASGIRFVP